MEILDTSSQDHKWGILLDRCQLNIDQTLPRQIDIESTSIQASLVPGFRCLPPVTTNLASKSLYSEYNQTVTTQSRRKGEPCEDALTETRISFWRNFHHWLQWKLSFWQLPVQPMMKISSKWRYFNAVCLLFHTNTVFARQIGTEDNPYMNLATIELYGQLLQPELPLFGAKVIGLYEGTIDMHGVYIMKNGVYEKATDMHGVYKYIIGNCLYKGAIDMRGRFIMGMGCAREALIRMIC